LGAEKRPASGVAAQGIFEARARTINQQSAERAEKFAWLDFRFSVYFARASHFADQECSTFDTE